MGTTKRTSGLTLRKVSNARFAVAHSSRSGLREPKYLLPAPHRLPNRIAFSAGSEAAITELFKHRQANRTRQAKAAKASSFLEGVLVLPAMDDPSTYAASFCRFGFHMRPLLSVRSMSAWAWVLRWTRPASSVWPSSKWIAMCRTVQPLPTHAYVFITWAVLTGLSGHFLKASQHLKQCTIALSYTAPNSIGAHIFRTPTLAAKSRERRIAPERRRSAAQFGEPNAE